MAEVYYASYHFQDAHDCYLRCFQLSSGEQEAFMESMKCCKREIAKEKGVDEKVITAYNIFSRNHIGHFKFQYPWVGAAVGIIISIAAVVADAVLLKEDAYLVHPLFKVFIVMLVSLTCYYFASKYREYMVASRLSLLQKPPDLVPEDDPRDKMESSAVL